MGDSLLETPNVEKKMRESVKSGARLEVSVSFGRFENDALSWEKWSSFSPNKYLEEVENLSTPGLVAQKKAYFEAHYKKIAARRAELEQETLMDTAALSLDGPSNEDHVENSSEVDAVFGLSIGDRLVEEVAHESDKYATDSTNVTFDNEAKDDHFGSTSGVEQEAFTKCLMRVVASEEEKDGAAVAAAECGSSAVEKANDELNCNVVEPELNVRTEAALIGVEICRKDDSQRIENEASEMKNGVERPTSWRKENSKLSARDVAQKVTPAKKEKNIGGSKKKAVQPAVQPSRAFAPTQAKTKSTCTAISASQSLQKKVNGSSLPKSKNSVVEESRRTAPASLHMSMSLGPANSSSALSVTRKSLIMEKMGDEDITKPAFKTFHNRPCGSSTSERSRTPKQLSSTTIGLKTSTPLIHAKAKAGLKKQAGKVAIQRKQSGRRSDQPLPSGSSALKKKDTSTVSPSRGLRIDERAEKRKEFRKKLEAQSIAKEAESAQLSTKSREEKESEIKKLRQGLNFKAKPLPSFYGVQGKAHLKKVAAVNDVR